jgi:hypothetical protein
MLNNATVPSSSAFNDVEGDFWAFGLVATFFSSCGSVTGTLFMKMAFKKYENIPVDQQRKCIGIPCTWRWWLGFVLLAILPTPLDAFSLGVASASLIFPFGVASTVVLGQIIAPRCFFKSERLGLWEWVGTFLVVLGAALSSAFGDHTSRKFTAAEIMLLWEDPTFLVLLLLSTVIFVCAVVLFHVPACKDKVPSLVLFFSLVYIPSYLGGVQTIMFKSFSEITTNTVQGTSNEWNTPWPYIFFMFVFVLAGLQLKYMNMGAERFQATKFFPAYNACLMICVVILGSIFFQEFGTLHPVAFPCGMVSIVGGIAFLASTDPSDSAAVAAIDRQEKERQAYKAGKQLESKYTVTSERNGMSLIDDEMCLSVTGKQKLFVNGVELVDI